MVPQVINFGFVYDLMAAFGTIVSVCVGGYLSFLFLKKGIRWISDMGRCSSPKSPSRGEHEATPEEMGLASSADSIDMSKFERMSKAEFHSRFKSSNWDSLEKKYEIMYEDDEDEVFIRKRDAGELS